MPALTFLGGICSKPCRRFLRIEEPASVTSETVDVVEVLPHHFVCDVPLHTYDSVQRYFRHNAARFSVGKCALILVKVPTIYAAAACACLYGGRAAAS